MTQHRSTSVSQRARLPFARGGHCQAQLFLRLPGQPGGVGLAGRAPTRVPGQRGRYLTILIVRIIPSWKCSRPSWAFMKQAIT